MIIPRHWDEAKQTVQNDGRRTTVRRFGWSSESADDARRHAMERLAEAVRQVESGADVEPRERKVPYNGADGLPIREEILEEDPEGRFVVTRNSYGAHCFNARDLLIADVDFDAPPLNIALGCGTWFGLSVVASVALTVNGFPIPAAIVIGVLAAGVLCLCAFQLFGAMLRRFSSPGRIADRRLERFLAKHQTWRVRAYETPRGRRLIALHRLFDPADDQASIASFFKAVHADPTYVRMCRLQRCFRARLTPKPWRIGIDDHLRPRPGVWPVAPERQGLRDRWVTRYEEARNGYAACRLLGDLGQGRPETKTERLADEHDRRAGATSDDPIA